MQKKRISFREDEEYSRLEKAWAEIHREVDRLHHKLDSSETDDLLVLDATLQQLREAEKNADAANARIDARRRELINEWGLLRD